MTRCYIFYMSSIGKMDIFLTILVYLCPEGLEKTAIDFSNSTFRIETGIIKLFIFRVLYFVISYS